MLPLILNLPAHPLVITRGLNRREARRALEVEATSQAELEKKAV